MNSVFLTDNMHVRIQKFSRGGGSEGLLCLHVCRRGGGVRGLFSVNLIAMVI